VLGLRHTADRERRAVLFALSWFVTTVVFFSLSPGKRTVYVLTMYPALAILIGAAVDALARHAPRERRWLGVPLAVLGPILTLATVGALALPRFGHRWPELLALGPSLPLRAAATAAALAVGAGLALALAAARRPVAAVLAVATGSAASGLLAALVLLPPFDVVKSARGLSAVYLERAGPDEPYAIWPRLDAPFLFYTERFSVPLGSEEELRRFAARPGRKWLLIERDDLARLEAPLPLVEVARDQDRRDGYLLMTDP